MSLMDRAIEAVAGRGLADRHEHRKLERTYQNAPQILKETTRVAREPVLPIGDDIACRSKYARTEALPGRQPREGSIRPSRLRMQRTQSELVEKRPIIQSPSGPPDITAWEVPDDQIPRTYSFSSAPGAKQYRMPPMPQMEGIGRYRVAVEAEDSWKIDHFRKCVDGIEMLYDKSDRLGIKESHPELWQTYQNAKPIRSASFASAASSRSASSLGLHEETVDPQTGTRICRGFAPSNPSSAASSFRETALPVRRDSGLSTKSNSADIDHNFVKIMCRPSAWRPQLSNDPDPLATINETKNIDSKQTRKQSVPCLFDVEGDPDSAMASVDDVSHDQSSAWVETCSVEGTGGIAEMLKEADLARRNQKVALQQATRVRTKSRMEAKKGLDRSKTIRAAPKALVRRLTADQKGSTVRKQNPTKLNSSDEEEEGEEEEDDEEEKAADIESKKTNNPIASNVSNASTKSEAVYMADAERQPPTDPKSNKDQTDHDHTSLKTDSTATTLVSGLSEPDKEHKNAALEDSREEDQQEDQKEDYLRNRRKRSATTIRTCSGKIGPGMVRIPSTEIEGN